MEKPESLDSQTRRRWRNAIRAAALLATFGMLLFALPDTAAHNDFSFVIIGDRTGEAVPGVYERVWRQAASEHPDFFINVGDTIQGEDDAAIDTEWVAAMALLKPYRRNRVYFTPGNHDVWSPASAAAYRKYTGYPLQYGFDHQQTHFTVLEDHLPAPMDPLPEQAMSFLANDLREHSGARMKFVFSHRPSWLLSALVKAKDAPLQTLARDYGVGFFIAGHIHQILHFDVDGVTYLSVPSAGGHLRASKRYEDGWFFGYTVVQVNGGDVRMTVKELGPPFGEGRTSRPQDWGGSGLLSRTTN